MPVVSGSGGGSISGVAVTGTAASGQVPVASSSSAGAWAYPPGYEIGYDQITGNVSVTSTTEATGTTVITCGAHTFDGGAVLATFFCPRINPSVSSALIASLFESTTQISRLGQYSPDSGLAAQVGVTWCYRFTPTAGSHTYTVTAFVNNATGQVITCGSGGTGGYPPAFIRFTKV